MKQHIFPNKQYDVNGELIIELQYEFNQSLSKR